MSEFAKDLAAAQSEMSNAALNKVNPHFKSKYADFSAVREATLPFLNKHGFCIIQMIDHQDGMMGLRTELLHKAGENRTSFYPIAPGTPQQQGSAITYARRYSWSSMCGIASEEDDDANAASSGRAVNPSQLRKSRDYAEFEKQMRLVTSEAKLEELIEKWQPVIKTWPRQAQETAGDEIDRAEARLSQEDDL